MERITKFRDNTGANGTADTARTDTDNTAEHPAYGSSKPHATDTADTARAGYERSTADDYPREWGEYSDTEHATNDVSTGQTQIDALGAMMGMVLQQLSKIPAQRRSQQWPPINGVPAGNHWLLDDAEALRLGEAWARVVVAYVPVDLIAGTGVIGGALSMTGVMLIVRIQQDAYIAQLVANAEAQAAETLRQQGYRPPGTVPMGEPTIDTSQMGV